MSFPVKPTSEWAGDAWGAIPWAGNFREPTSALPTQIINPPLPAINTSERWYTPDVAGPISLAAPIPSGERWPTPTVNLVQTIAPSAAIPSSEHWFSLTVQIVQQITLAAKIPSGEHWPTPTVEGGPLFVNVRGIPSGESWPVPSVTGGRGGFQLFLGGIDYTKYMSIANTQAQITSQTLGRWQFTFELSDWVGQLYQNAIASPAVSPPPPIVGMTVLVMDNGLRVFAGCIQSIVHDRVINQPYAALYQIIATDKSAICDHRIVTGQTYPAGADVGQTILTIVNNYLNGEGIGVSGVPTDGSLGDLGSDLVLNFVTVTQAFDQIATLSGTVWWIDTYCNLHFSPLVSLPVAPISLTETSKNYRQSKNGQTNARGGRLQVTKTTVDYYNKLYAVSNLAVVPGTGGGGAGGGNTETYTWALGQPGIVSATGYPSFTLAQAQLQVSAGIGSVLSMTVNGVAQTVINFADYNGQVPTGPPDYWWFFQSGGSILSPTYGSSIPNGATIVVEYIPYNASGSSQAQYGEALNPVAPSGESLGTCGSGVYEGVIQVKDINTQSDLNAIALAELNRIGGIPTMVDFETDAGGLFPGQLLSVNVPISGISAGQLLITQMVGTLQAAPLESGFRFWWDVRATSILDPGNYVTWYERLVGRTANPLPVAQYEQALFYLGGGGSTVDPGTSITNPYPVASTGSVLTIQLACAVPPVDQNLVLQITDNNVIIAEVTLLQSALPNQLFVTTFLPNQVVVLAQDVLNINASYNVTGGSPQEAQGVTLQLRWST